MYGHHVFLFSILLLSYKMTTINNTDIVQWIKDGVDKEYINYHNYDEFKNVKSIGAGGFGKVYRANWKNDLEQHFVLKSFLSLNNATVKEIVSEVTTKYNTRYIFLL